MWYLLPYADGLAKAEDERSVTLKDILDFSVAQTVNLLLGSTPIQSSFSLIKTWHLQAPAA